MIETGYESLRASLTDGLVNFVVSLKYEQLPFKVVTAAKQGFLDNLGVALVGSHEPDITILRQVLKNSGEAGQATVVGTGAQTSFLGAAMVNGQAAHALDFDDVQYSAVTHISSPVVPALLAAGEMRHCFGKDVLAAYVAGFEVGVGLGRADGFGSHMLYTKGVHPTAFLGHFGAVAGVGNLIGLDQKRMHRAFGIAASQAAGLRRAFGTMTNPMHTAKAAANGFLSALLAEQGLTSSEDIFDGECSVFHLFDFQMRTGQLLDGLGRQFNILQNSFKPFACPAWRIPIIEGIIQLSCNHDLRPHDVSEIHVEVSPRALGLPNYSEPETGLQGTFSAEHAAAAALAERAGGINQFTDEKVRDPALIALRRKVKLSGNKSLKQWQANVRICFTDGREFSHSVRTPKGMSDNPMTQEELETKFQANASKVLPLKQVEELLRMIRELEKVQDLAHLLELCRVKPHCSP